MAPRSSSSTTLRDLRGEKGEQKQTNKKQCRPHGAGGGVDGVFNGSCNLLYRRHVDYSGGAGLFSAPSRMKGGGGVRRWAQRGTRSHHDEPRVQFFCTLYVCPGPNSSRAVKAAVPLLVPNTWN